MALQKKKKSGRGCRRQPRKKQPTKTLQCSWNTIPRASQASFVLCQSPASPFAGKVLVQFPGHGHLRTQWSGYCSSSPLVQDLLPCGSVEALPLGSLEALLQPDVCQARPLSQARLLSHHCSGPRLRCQSRSRACQPPLSEEELLLRCMASKTKKNKPQKAVIKVAAWKQVMKKQHGEQKLCAKNTTCN